MPKSIEDEFGRIEDDELRQKQKEYEFMMLTPNLVKQPGIEVFYKENIFIFWGDEGRFFYLMNEG